MPTFPFLTTHYQISSPPLLPSPIPTPTLTPTPYFLPAKAIRRSLRYAERGEIVKTLRFADQGSAQIAFAIKPQGAHRPVKTSAKYRGARG